MTTKQKRERFTSPKGVAVWPRLNSPDIQWKEWGEYGVRLRFKGKDKGTVAFLSQLEDLYDAAIEEQRALLPENKRSKMKLCDKPWREAVDDQGKETGEIEVNFKMAASYKDKNTGNTIPIRPALFDAKGAALDPSKVKIGGGSLLKVNFFTKGFYTGAVGAGISLRLNAVQVLKLIEWGGGSSDSFGFKAEDGFDSNEGGDDNSDLTGDVDEVVDEPETPALAKKGKAKAKAIAAEDDDPEFA